MEIMQNQQAEIDSKLRYSEERKIQSLVELSLIKREVIELLGENNGYYKVALTMDRYTEPNGIDYLYTNLSSSGNVYINLNCLI